MMPCSLKEIVSAVNGELLQDGGVETVCGVETDSRACTEGMLFVPLIAARDGHQFIGNALSSGAAAALCSAVPERLLSGKAYIRVDDTRLALKALAAWYRSKFDIPFIQITGSVGKTTTKEMIAAVLEQRYKTLKTAGNFNNDIGVPKTLFRLQQETEIAVVETGMNHAGEIRYLGEMIRPDAAVITNVGDSHIEYLGSRENILKAKCEIFEHLKPDGFALLNGDDALLRTAVPPCTVLYCGEGADCDIRVTDIEECGVEGLRCTVRTASGAAYPLTVPAAGRHMIYAAAFAVALGERYGVGRDAIIAGAASYEPAGERMRTLNGVGGSLVLSDCYNANPQSMAAAIEVLSHSGRSRTAAVLGDMGELGAISQRAHYEMGALCAARGVGTVIAIGEKAREIAKGARDGGCKTVYAFDTKADAASTLDTLRGGDLAVLVKASHAMAFQEISQRLTAL